MTKRAKQCIGTVFIGETPGTALRRAVAVLNDGSSGGISVEARRNLVALVEAWQRARSAHPNRFELAQQAASADKLLAPLPKLLKMEWPAGAPDLNQVSKDFRVSLAPAGDGAIYLINYAPARPWNAWDRAWGCFLWLIADPAVDRFAGPCKRCQKYFVRKTAKKSVYCSQRCASLNTAVEATTRRRQQVRERKLAVARKAIGEWQELPRARQTKTPWKKYTVTYNPDAEITSTFLTRAVNSGELQPPQD